jgi:ACS family hexuronate transporter-like MFS transporter
MTQEIVAAPAVSGRTIRHLRWYICALLFVVTTINYVDRNTMSVLNPILKKEIGWDDGGYGWITFSFSLAYALMFGVSGSMLDKFGVRIGMIWAVIVWSIAALGHSFANGVLGFAIARFALGLGEAANFPGCIKSIAEWFPKSERALATGIFNSGTNIGVMFAPAIVWIATTWGWRMAFILAGGIGFLWLVAWVMFYRAPEQHPNLGEAERKVIFSDKEAAVVVKVPWTSLLRYRQVWAFVLGKWLTDPIWIFYLYWLPTYLTTRGIKPQETANLMLFPYTAASVGSVAGGLLSSTLIKRGWAVGRARLLAMAVFAFCMPWVFLAVRTDDLRVALGLISLATAAHQAWSANLFTITSDMFPKKMVGSVVGLGGIAGALGGMFMNLLTGGVLAHTHSYVLPFLIAGFMHPIGFFLVWAFAGREFKQADISAGAAASPSRNLALVGSAVSLGGLALIALVVAKWALLTTKSVHPAWQGLTGSIGIVLIGLALLYASRGDRSAQSRVAA